MYLSIYLLFFLSLSRKSQLYKVRTLSIVDTISNADMLHCNTPNLVMKFAELVALVKTLHMSH